MLVGVVSLLVLMDLADGSGRILGHFRILRLAQMVPVLALTLLAALLLAASFSSERAARLADVSNRVQGLLPSRGWLSAAYLVVPALLLPFYLASPLKSNIEHVLPGVWFAGNLVVVSAVLLQAAQEFSFFKCIVIALLSYAIVYQLSLFLPQISNYPFSLGWSESSQYYFALDLLLPPDLRGARLIAGPEPRL